jgi:hypothetical protein
MDRTFRPINCLIARNLKTYLYQRRTNTGLNCGSDLIPVLPAQWPQLTHLQRQTPTRSNADSGAIHASCEVRAPTIIGEFEQAETEFVSKAVILADGKAGRLDTALTQALPTTRPVQLRTTQQAGAVLPSVAGRSGSRSARRGWRRCRSRRMGRGDTAEALA